ncbi:MAG: DUF4292 domain-containing protein [Prevotella sp.]|jgi:hypothetical protein|nr:DUF4292 domain-containing protein [Prevotella sp.]MBR3481240.1 DUF4292 domain-containing protein [Prevotella sp.]MBR6189727.1 DUF4292 domain-containing protein [Prevotella sp.]
MKATTFLKMAALVLPLMLASCHSKKQAVVEEPKPITQQQIEQNEFLQMVQDNSVQKLFVTSKLKFTVEMGDRKMTLTGNLRMKRDDVIMLQLMAFGFVEAGRLEFTKDYVLIMDRVNKLYLKTPYRNVSFLRNSGINFHTLQALFWNELFLPNEEAVDTTMFTRFATTRGGEEVIINFEEEGSKMNYTWLANDKTGQIKMANIAYRDHLKGNTQLNWDYQAFEKMGKQQFPSEMNVTLTTPEKEVMLGIKLTYLDNKSDWETRTKVSDKYRQVTVDEILQRFLSLG